MTAEARARGEWLLGDSLVGVKSGWLEVIATAERPADASEKIRGTWWLCRCRCGGEKVLPRQYITQKNATSCGCKKRGPKINVDPSMLVRDEKDERQKKPIKLAYSCNLLTKVCTCSCCGKEFERTSDEWAYKATIGSREHWFCSWKCLRKVTAR